MYKGVVVVVEAMCTYAWIETWLRHYKYARR